MSKFRFFLFGAAAIIPYNALGWGPGPGGGGDSVGNGGWYHQGAYQNGYYAGTQDAIYDHQNNLIYSDQPGCLSCHSQSFDDGFKHGYGQQWNSYQSQESTQGTSINVVGDNNYISTNQVSQQNPLQQLAHTLCGLVNCNGQGYVNNGPVGLQGIGYGGPDP